MKKVFFAALFLNLLALTNLASEPAVWSVTSRADVLKGDARGVSIGADGELTPSPRLTEVFKTGQPYIWSSAADAAGNVYLGTGGDGKVFRVDTSGKGVLFADLAEMNISAVAVGKNGEIYAGTSPDGKVYKIDAAGKAETWFEPKEKYIWALAVLSDGTLAVGTGDGGKIYRVRAANSTPEASLLFDTSETHIITLTADTRGNLYAGTDSNGLVMRFGPDGKPFGLLDSPLREIHDLSVGPDGSVYVLAIGESVSSPKAADAAATTAAAESKTVSVDKPGLPGTDAAPKSRYDLSAAKSAVYRVSPDGGTDIIWASASVTGFSIHAQANGVLLGTSDKGRIYSISNEGRETLVLQTDASQISTLLSSATGMIATSSNQGSMYRFGPDTVPEGSYESAVLDAKATATWGRVWWRSAGGVTLQTRSGNTEKTDETWSSWSTALTDPHGGQIASPKARYLQWRAVLKTSGASLSEVNVAFIARNIAPEILTVQVLPTNVGLAANPPLQIDPNIELSGLDPATFGIPSAAIPPRRVYQRGATSLQWTAEDRNGDRLVYDVLYKEAGETAFKLFRGDLTDAFLTIDGQALADGRYLFKVVARDTPSNPESLALAGERTTEPVDIDNTPPTVTAFGTPQVTGERARLIFDGADTASYVTRAEYSVNGSDWRPVFADDGISDGPRERYTVDIPVKNAGEYAVTIRVYDVNGNAGNARTIIKK